jgi:hypothetical protein
MYGNLCAREIHDLFHLTLDNAHISQLKIQTNAQGVSGTGLTTGDKYQAQVTHNLEDTVHTVQVGHERTFVSNLRIIGQGNGNNFLAQVHLHITVNADGTVTAFYDNFSAECK